MPYYCRKLGGLKRVFCTSKGIAVGRRAYGQREGGVELETSGYVPFVAPDAERVGDPRRQESVKPSSVFGEMDKKVEQRNVTDKSNRTSSNL